MALKTKQCARKSCLKSKPVSEFPHDARQKDGYAVWCKDCWREYQQSRKTTSTTPITGGKTKVVAKTSKVNAPATKGKAPAKVVKTSKASKKESETEAN